MNTRLAGLCFLALSSACLAQGRSDFVREIIHTYGLGDLRFGMLATNIPGLEFDRQVGTTDFYRKRTDAVAAIPAMVGDLVCAFRSGRLVGFIMMIPDPATHEPFYKALRHALQDQSSRNLNQPQKWGNAEIGVSTTPQPDGQLQVMFIVKDMPKDVALEALNRIGGPMPGASASGDFSGEYDDDSYESPGLYGPSVDCPLSSYRVDESLGPQGGSQCRGSDGRIAPAACCP